VSLKAHAPNIYHYYDQHENEGVITNAYIFSFADSLGSELCLTRRFSWLRALLDSPLLLLGALLDFPLLLTRSNQDQLSYRFSCLAQPESDDGRFSFPGALLDSPLLLAERFA
jgi:hypothetical protein